MEPPHGNKRFTLLQHSGSTKLRRPPRPDGLALEKPKNGPDRRDGFGGQWMGSEDVYCYSNSMVKVLELVAMGERPLPRAPPTGGGDNINQGSGVNPNLPIPPAPPGAGSLGGGGGPAFAGSLQGQQSAGAGSLQTQTSGASGVHQQTNLPPTPLLSGVVPGGGGGNFGSSSVGNKGVVVPGGSAQFGPQSSSSQGLSSQTTQLTGGSLGASSQPGGGGGSSSLGLTAQQSSATAIVLSQQNGLVGGSGAHSHGQATPVGGQTRCTPGDHLHQQPRQGQSSLSSGATPFNPNARAFVASGAPFAEVELSPGQLCLSPHLDHVVPPDHQPVAQPVVVQPVAQQGGASSSNMMNKLRRETSDDRRKVRINSEF